MHDTVGKGQLWYDIAQILRRKWKRMPCVSSSFMITSLLLLLFGIRPGVLHQSAGAGGQIVQCWAHLPRASSATIKGPAAS